MPVYTVAYSTIEIILELAPVLVHIAAIEEMLETSDVLQEECFCTHEYRRRGTL